MIDLNEFHHDVHQISGAMALRFNRATPADLRYWAAKLHALAEQMTAVAQATTAATADLGGCNSEQANAHR